MLGGDDNRGGADRLAVDIAQGHLALGVGAEHRFGAGMPGLGQGMQDRMGVIDGGRHQLGGLGAGETEHDALVAGAFVLVARGVDALGDVGRLGVDQHLDLGAAPMETVLLIADVADGGAGHLLDLLMGHRGRPANLAGHDDAVGGAHGFDRHARGRIGGEEGVDHRVGDAIADLVRMALGDQLAGEQVI